MDCTGAARRRAGCIPLDTGCVPFGASSIPLRASSIRFDPVESRSIRFGPAATAYKRKLPAWPAVEERIHDGQEQLANKPDVAYTSKKSIGGCKMALPPLYKYLDARGAKLTLGNGTFKHAKPSDFNDAEDLTVQSIFQESTESALTKISSAFPDILFRHVNHPPTCDSPMKQQVEILQRVFLERPDAIEIIKAEWNREGQEPVYDLEHMHQVCVDFIRYINGFLQEHRVLCVTVHKESEKMWHEYAEGHKGIALRIEPNEQKDSKFKLFRPVQYRETRPPFYEDSLDFITGALFGNQQARATAALDKIVYSKTLAWQHEGEYRLVIPLREGEQWNTDKYHPEEITELYLGILMSENDKEEIIAMARNRNPQIAIFQMRRDMNNKLIADQI
ncbi:MAG: DUF2971 domain-containing protein [Ferrovibrio sp.]|uniref:DUF2971 domain-containing protein n=1 Tax=Ferrovibrio sp. TaxID=1917215 RepID=UPI00260C747B|nr:DUF2971 domain-containing protein [Ferrovibrio sp.]MCW0235931.1 DUF2971 domain-containing protein [Ferrovibrio sp.]